MALLNYHLGKPAESLADKDAESFKFSPEHDAQLRRQLNPEFVQALARLPGIVRGQLMPEAVNVTLLEDEKAV